MIFDIVWKCSTIKPICIAYLNLIAIKLHLEKAVRQLCPKKKMKKTFESAQNVCENRNKTCKISQTTIGFMEMIRPIYLLSVKKKLKTPDWPQKNRLISRKKAHNLKIKDINIDFKIFESIQLISNSYWKEIVCFFTFAYHITKTFTIFQ